MTDESEEATETTTTKPLKEVPVIRDDGFFTHSTGDTYEGSFEIKKKDLLAKMLGQGVYTTAEADTYTGNWDYDRLGGNDPVNIKYSDAAKYEGGFKDWCYSGVGSYTYPDESVLACNFNENCPTGQLTLTDPNGHIWLGKAELGFGWFEPVNHFYTLLEKRDNPTMKHRRRKTLETQNL